MLFGCFSTAVCSVRILHRPSGLAHLEQRGERARRSHSIEMYMTSHETNAQTRASLDAVLENVATAVALRQRREQLVE